MATVPMWAKPLVEKQENTDKLLDEHAKRIAALENVYTDIDEIKQGVGKTVQWIRRGIPTLITAAITAGFVNGQLGEFLKALIN